MSNSTKMSRYPNTIFTLFLKPIAVIVELLKHLNDKSICIWKCLLHVVKKIKNKHIHYFLFVFLVKTLDETK